MKWRECHFSSTSYARIVLRGSTVSPATILKQGTRPVYVTRWPGSLHSSFRGGWCRIPSILESSCPYTCKKRVLNTNVPSNFRPVTLSSVFSKLLEYEMTPADDVCDTQFGFRAARGTAHACTLYNDTVQYFKKKMSPLYAYRLDAEKCFDSLSHSELFRKLYGLCLLCVFFFNFLCAICLCIVMFSSC